MDMSGKTNFGLVKGSTSPELLTSKWLDLFGKTVAVEILFYMFQESTGAKSPEEEFLPTRLAVSPAVAKFKVILYIER